MRTFTLALLFILSFGQLYANSPFTIRVSLKWEDAPSLLKVGSKTLERWRFEGAMIGEKYPTLPWYMTQFVVNAPGNLRVEIVSARYEPFERQPGADDKLLSEQLNFQTSVARERGSIYNAKLSFVPIIRRGNAYERLVEAELRITHEPKLDIQARGPFSTTVSALSEGDLYKFATTDNRVFKLDYNFLKNKLGIANLDNIDPRNIKILGNGGGMLPFFTGTDRADDVVENPVQVIGEDDGKFDPTDYILFYGEGADKWSYDAASEEFNMEKNVFDNKNYYFVKISNERGKRITTQNAISNTAYTSTTFNAFARLEQDKTNLLYYWSTDFGTSTGSGLSWFGDLFKGSREFEYKNLFSFPNITTDSAKVKIVMALRSLQSSRFSAVINGQTFNSTYALYIGSLTNNEEEYAEMATLDTKLPLTSGDINVQVRYPNPSGSGDNSQGWLDFIQMNVRRKLIMAGNQMDFRDVQTLAYPTTTFQLENANGNVLIWDISNPIAPVNQGFSLNGTTLTFGAATTNLKTFLAFDKNQKFPEPEAVGKIGNQNVHRINNVDMVVVYHPDFETEAKRFAEHREKHSGLTVELARIDHLYNEFASGKADPTAIRDFAKMLYERTSRFKYLLLFGDGSFDNRNIYGLGGNFIPVFENDNLDPVAAFPSDDYFGILNSASRDNVLLGDVNIAIGRFPVKTLQEAKTTVDKIINYDTNTETLSDWRNRLVFVGDDEDGSQHSIDVNSIADQLLSQNRFINLNKIYLDAFPQVSASGGARFPEAKAELNRSVFRGALAVTYLGHGGEKGWAQERVLEISDIVNWDNADHLPLFMTATCSFTGYDNPTFTTAGEEAFLNPKGGAIALMTTVRAVYATENAALTRATLLQLFTRENGKYLPMGEAFRKGKNAFTNVFTVTNSRKFSLIGDPSMKLAIPEYSVKTTKINKIDAGGSATDTLRALQRVTVEGVVTDLNGQPLTSFNGLVYPTIFDKATTVTNLQQDGDSRKFDFVVQRNILFKGRASAKNGAFKFTFIVPKDINYNFGIGKISYYAADEQDKKDATGSYEQFIIGGTDNSAIADKQGPNVDVFMNSEDFVFGGTTNPNPTLLVKLRDDNGINIVGNSIGHDLEGVLNNDTQNSYLLNDFYESELDDYTRGTVRYPLFKLPEGRHEMKVTAWDVANNAAQGYTEFFVSTSSKVALDHVLNYPNPFTDRTCFQFDHNLANQEMSVLIQIFTISGRLVKTLEQNILSDGTLRRDDCIAWDGRDDYGDRLARGVYLYKVKVRASLAGTDSLQGESDFEKLVILK